MQFRADDEAPRMTLALPNGESRHVPITTGKRITRERHTTRQRLWTIPYKQDEALDAILSPAPTSLSPF